MKYIDIANIGFKYESEPVLENISFQVSAGEFIILTGENEQLNQHCSVLFWAFYNPIKVPLLSPKRTQMAGDF